MAGPIVGLGVKQRIRHYISRLSGWFVCVRYCKIGRLHKMHPKIQKKKVYYTHSTLDNFSHFYLCTLESLDAFKFKYVGIYSLYLYTQHVFRTGFIQYMRRLRYTRSCYVMKIRPKNMKLATKGILYLKHPHLIVCTTSGIALSYMRYLYAICTVTYIKICLFFMRL